MNDLNQYNIFCLTCNGWKLHTKGRKYYTCLTCSTRVERASAIHPPLIWGDPETKAVIAAAQALRAIPSEARAQASRDNGKKGGRKRRCHECKEEIKPGDSWERHSYGKGRYLYCSNCAERIRQEQYETDRMEDRRYP